MNECGKAPHPWANSCQQDLYLLATGGYPEVPRGKRAEAARLIVGLHAHQAGADQPSWKEAAKVVFDALLVSSIIRHADGIKGLFLVDLQDAGFRSQVDGEAAYHRLVIERVLNRVADYLQSNCLDGTCYPDFRAGAPDQGVARRLAATGVGQQVQAGG